ncbi:TonB-dependent receptor [Chromatocurvus halotolerans]|uniref:Outer membrane receptor protein involved in Fe transport n=1 Tax=Chromatocurvus halotolerans TaxID=1132028 RepID=A0A4R2KQZ1_9GAMM|nr:TonB-dependent receptor [Chromatocurvus halotolerans]TCO75152.1 outer membrane receptor protein involved in Fe transport [Chromatocurvus halotolerans]
MAQTALSLPRSALPTILFLSVPGLLAASALAGSAAPPRDGAEPGTDANGRAIEEVIVYARRREESLQTVPVALDALDAQMFFRRGLYQLADVTAQSASVHLEQGSVPQDINLNIRGLTPTRGRPNMAVLLDGIDITTEAMITSGGTLLIDPLLFDVEQIEIVKGPQHALYGRSAFAGAISYKTRGPGDTFAYAIETDIGNYGQQMIRGRVSGPVLGDTLRLGVSAATWNHDGFYDSPITGGDLGDRSGSSGAITFALEPSREWAVQGRLSYEESEFGIQPQGHPAPDASFAMPASALGPVVDPSVTAILGIRGTPPSAGDLTISNSDNPRTGREYPGSSQEVLRATLDVTREFDNLGGLGRAQFISLTHLASADSFQYQDFNAFGRADDLPAFGEIWIDNETRLFSQEIRLQSAGDGPLTWTVGAEYWEENRETLNGGVTCLTYAPPFLSADIAPNCGPFVAAVGTTLPRNSDLWTRDIEHWAAFGLVGWAFNDHWELTFEARYVDEQLEVSGPDLDNSIIDPLGIFGGGSVLFPVPAGQVLASQDDSFVAPKATLQYTISDNAMTYFSLAQGIKPAGISTVNGGGGTFQPEQGRFDREQVIVYELGAKTDLFNRRLRVNGALFLQDFTDKQVTSQVPDANGFLVARVLNADAEVYGAELDVTLLATDRLSLQAGYTFLESEFTDFTQLTSSAGAIAYAGGCEVVTTTAGRSTCRVDFTGNDLERVPRHSFVGIVNYTDQLTANSNWFAEVQTTFRDERFSNQSNLLRFDSYWLTDLRLGVASGNWEAMAYVDNLFDDETIRDGFNTGGYINDFSLAGATFVLPDSAQFYLPPPRAFGLRASYSFGR